ncbi:hypothetical protein [Nostoc sp. UHCC 0251]|uniref:hypothetical protein n=1 Tax=Nostoc sp. UHCC 0251 TaxID=3110240 RepID=UPI002B1F61E0|nr:hypothetical protein [Nostoc sp. UHCC 0251]MEA5622105.1 hypothetical protein [Nostoc sp. UHCC 0251]
MSLTSELKNRNSPIRRWFDSRLNKTVIKMITNHNQLLENQEIIRPIDGVDFPLVGSAIAKALAKYLGSIYEDKTWFTNCLAQVGAKALKIEYAFDYSITNSNSLEEEALKCMLLGALENYARSRNIHEIIQPFLQGEKSLQLEAEYFTKWLPSIQDTSQIIGIVPRTWQTVANQVSGNITCNASYPLSEYLGGADCQIIAGNTLIDVRTTAKKRPFSLENFYQQISYVLLDSNDTYTINQLVWFYSRQQSVFFYPTDKIFRDLQATREEFKKMILDNYHTNRLAEQNKCLYLPQ